MTLKAYFDTNIYISYVLGPEKDKRNFPLANSIFKEVSLGKYNVQVTHLTLQELLNAYRRIATTKKLLPLDRFTRDNIVRTESNGNYQNTVKLMLASPQAFIFSNPNMLDINNILKNGLIIMNKNLGKVNIYSDCRQCGSIIKNVVYKGISPDDIIHVFLANELKCDTFLTLDKGFECLEKDPIIGSLDLQVIE